MSSTSRSIRPAKKAKLESPAALQEEEFRNELRRKDEALQTAMKLLCGPYETIPTKWEDMPEILRNDPTALTQAIVGKRRFNIRRRSEINEQVLQQALPDLNTNYRQEAIKFCETGFLKWGEVNPTAEEWKQSPELFKQALLRGMVRSPEDISFSLLPTTMANLIKGRHIDWNRIPTSLRNDLGFCRLVLDPENASSPSRDDAHLARLAIDIFRLHPQLAQDRPVWEKIVCSEHVFYLFRDGFHPADADLIEEACKKFRYPMEYVDQMAFADLVRNMIDSNANNLFHAKEHFIETNRDLVISTLAQVHPNTYDLIFVKGFARDVPSTMWNDEDFERTWFQAGLPLVSESHSPDWYADPDKLLLIAEHCCHYKWKSEAFRHPASNHLLSNASFVAKVMDFDPCLFEHASETLRNENYELAIWALADRRFFDRCLGAVRRPPGFWIGASIIIQDTKMDEYYARAAEELEAQAAFVDGFLFAVRDQFRFQQHPFLKDIGEFVGIPRGNHLRNIRKALAMRRPHNAGGGKE